MTLDILADAVEALEQRVNASDRLLWALYIEAEEPPLTVRGYADKMLSVGVDTTLALARFREAREGKAPSQRAEGCPCAGCQSVPPRAHRLTPAPLDPVALERDVRPRHRDDLALEKAWAQWNSSLHGLSSFRAAIETYLHETGRTA